MTEPHPNSIWPALPSRKRCPICGRHFTVRGFTRHLKRCASQHHGPDITREELLKLYPRLYAQAYHRLVEKLFRLIDIDPYYFGWQRPFVYRDVLNENRYRVELHRNPITGRLKEHVVTVVSEPETVRRRLFFSRKDWDSLPLDAQWGYYIIKHEVDTPDKYIQEGKNGTFIRSDNLPLRRRITSSGAVEYPHFKATYRGVETLGIRMRLNNRCLCLEIDSLQKAQIRRAVKLVKAEGLTPHVEFSGSKGYHLWILCDETLPHETLTRAGQWIVDKAKIRHLDLIYPNNGVIKIPLAIHRKTGQLCGFVDSQFEVLSAHDQIKYFFKITPDDADTLRDLAYRIKTPGHTTSPSKPPEIKPDVLFMQPPSSGARMSQNNLYGSLIASGEKMPNENSHTSLFRFGWYLRQQGLSLGEARKQLHAWAQKVDSTRDTQIVRADVDESLNRIYAKPIRPTVLLSDEEKKAIEISCCSLLPELCTNWQEKRECDRSRIRNNVLRIALFMAERIKAGSGRGTLAMRYIANGVGMSKCTVGHIVNDILCPVAFVRVQMGNAPGEGSTYTLSAHLRRQV